MSRRSTLRRSLAALTLAAVTVPVTASLAVAATPTILLDDLSQHPAVKPQRFEVTRTARMSGLRWSHWGARTATAKGTFTINTCQPSCAKGRLRVLRGAQLQVRGVRIDQGHRYYRQYRIKVRNASSGWINAYVPSDFR